MGSCQGTTAPEEAAIERVQDPAVVVLVRRVQFMNPVAHL